MQALVTGASGFLGGRLVEMLRGRGAQVAVLARASSVLAARPDVQLLRIDLNSTRDSTLDPQLVAALSAFTHIFHCAGCSTDWAPTPQFEQSNVDGVAAMLRLAKAHAPRLKRFIHVSTTDVYGYPRVAGDETCLPHDVGLPYNSSKLRGEALVWTAAAEGLPVTVVRPASIYGPAGKAFVTDIVTLLRQRLMLLVDGGRTPGGFVYVDDVCEAMVLAAESQYALGQAYNISSVDDLTWKAYTGALAASLGVPAPWLQLPFHAAMALAAASEIPHKLGLPGRPLLTRHATFLLGRDQQYSTAKAQEQLGWQPRVMLGEGLARSVAALRR